MTVKAALKREHFYRISRMTVVKINIHFFSWVDNPLDGRQKRF
jgi:hypothetical protein